MKTCPLFSLVAAFTGALAVFLAGCSGDPQSREAAKVDVNAQIEQLKSSDSDARVNACIELGKAGPRAEAAVQPLIEALKDSEPMVRNLAAYALMMIGDAAKPAVPALKEGMNDPDQRVVTSCMNALGIIEPSALGGMAPRDLLKTTQ